MRHYMTRDGELVVIGSTLADSVAHAVAAMDAENTSHADVQDENGETLGTVWVASYTGKVLYAYAGDFPNYHEYTA